MPHDNSKKDPSKKDRHRLPRTDRVSTAEPREQRQMKRLVDRVRVAMKQQRQRTSRDRRK